MKLDRWGDITSELSSNLVKSIVLPAGFVEWLTRPLSEKLFFKPGSHAARVMESSDQHLEIQPAGPMLLFGGTSVPDEAIVAIIHLVGGRSAKLAIVPVAAFDSVTTAEESIRFFTRFGMRNLQVLDVVTRERAQSPEWAARLAECDGVFLCGDSPERGLKVLRESLCADVLREMQSAGKLVAGIAGGAAILAERVLLKKDDGECLSAGLGLAPRFVIEPEFTQRARFNSMVKALNEEGKAANLIGIGIDGGAALVVRECEAKVLGEAQVTLIYPSAGETTAAAVRSTLTEHTLVGLRVHVLTDGCGINLRTRRLIHPAREVLSAANQV